MGQVSGSRYRMTTKSLAIFILFMPATCVAALCPEPDAPEAPLPEIALKEFVGGLEKPVHLTHPNDDSQRLFVVEQHGIIRIIDDGRLLPEPFLDIRDKVDSGGEKGLLSVAFHPDYADNGLFFVNYTTYRRGLYTVVSRFKRNTATRADPGSEEVLLRIKQPFANHNGGLNLFGPDGYLYIGMGDGGLAHDPFGHGQNPSTLLGALLRIDVDHPGDDRPYTIPDTNPFTDREGVRGEVWAFGLRNPWRFSFDAQTGRLFLADVGQDRIEEIDIITTGGNYGWDIMEGNRCTDDEGCRREGMEMPIYSYLHPAGFSITGGFVYRGGQIPGLCGAYVYGDYVTRRIWGLRYRDGEVKVQGELVDAPDNISSFGEDRAHELYVLGHRKGKIMKIVPAAE